MTLPTLTSPDPPRKPPKSFVAQHGRLLLVLAGVAAALVMVAAATTTGVLLVNPSEHPVAAWPSSTNPVIDQNYPDPFVLKDNNQFYSFATNDFGSNVQTATSANLLNWTKLPDSLPVLPSWSDGWVWAANVHLSLSGDYNMVFAARFNKTRMAIGLAISPSGPAGPYEPLHSDYPLVDMPQEGGAIDPSYFRDDNGDQYLIWKSDGNAVSATCAIWCQGLAADGLSLIGLPWPLLRDDQSWEYEVIEAPNLIKRGNVYYLYYSAGHYFDWTYTVAYATSTSIIGPFVKHGRVLSTMGDLVGPGKCCTIEVDSSSIWMVFHSLYFLPDRADPRITYRAMDILPMSYDSKGRPIVSNSWGNDLHVLLALNVSVSGSH